MTLTEKKEEILKEFKEKFNPEESCAFVPEFLEKALDTYAESVKANTKVDLIGLFHGVVEDLYGAELADMTMSRVNEAYLQSQKKGQTEEEI